MTKRTPPTNPGESGNEAAPLSKSRAYWSSSAHSSAQWPGRHCRYLASAPPVSEEDLPPIRSPRKWVSIHLKRVGFEQVRKLARQYRACVADLVDTLATQALAADEHERLRATGA